jgi:Domain of unknown function (DUF4191)
MVKMPGGTARQAQNTAKQAQNKAKGAADDPAAAGRFKQIWMIGGFIRKTDPRALPIIIGSGVAVLVVLVVVSLLTGQAALLIPLGVLLGIMTSLLLFTRYARETRFKALAGQPGAAGEILRTLRGNWTFTPGVAFNRDMDLVHRIVGRPGVILVGEGSPNRLAILISAEKKKMARIAYGVPITELQVGTEKGQIPIRKLERTVMKLPRNLKPPAVTDLNNRLKALPSAMRGPGGPMPRAGRMPRPPRPKVR